MMSQIPQEFEAQERIDKLYEILRAQNNPRKQVDLSAILQHSAEMLGLEIAIVSHIEGNTYTIVDFACPPEAGLFVGQTFELGNTYCHITYQADGLVDISSMKDSIYNGHPCYSSFGLESYIGSPVWVNGERYGTLNFSSPSPRSEDFNQFDRDFVLFLAQWVGGYIERANHNEELNKLNEELRTQNEELKKLLAEKDELTYIILHDIKAPLFNLQTIVKLGIEKEAMDRETILELCSASFTSAFELISELDEVQKIEKKKVNVDLEKIDIDQFSKDLLAEFETNASEKDIAIQYSCSPAPLELYTDHRILKRILYNLISNALKFSPFSKKVFISVSKTNKTAIIEVKDQGPGIKAENQHLLFKKFERLGAKPTHNEPSTGLGLYIVKELSSKINADIEVESKFGHGATFRLKLPLRQNN